LYGASQRRRALFTVYSRNLAFYRPEKQGVVLCPFCLREFSTKALDRGDPRLTLAHIVSYELGGRKAALARTRCAAVHRVNYRNPG
jgi:hypothetical protein